MEVKVAIEMSERDWGILGAIDLVRKAMLECNRWGDEEYRSWAYQSEDCAYNLCRKTMMEMLMQFAYHHNLRGEEFARAMDDLSGDNGESFVWNLKNNGYYLMEHLR